MILFLCRIAVLIITCEPPAILAQLKLSPPWTTVIQHVNENYNVQCEGEGEKVWKHDNGQIDGDNLGHSITVIKKHDNGLHLRFNKIQKEFKGFYNCSATIKGKKFSKGFELIVIKPVTFINTAPTESMVFNEGDEIMLHCDTEGEPPAIISWFFNSELIPDTNNAQVLRNNSLKIANASWKNSGTYICRAFQKILQTRDAEMTYDVKIRHKPTSYTGQLQTNIFGFRNESKNITCRVDAYPAAYFIWYRNNLPIDPKEHNVKIHNEENISILEISKIHENILGIYDCEAANPLGLLIQQVNLRIISKPVIPRLLVNEYSDSTAVISVIIESYPTHNFTVHIDCTKYTYCSYEEKWQRGFNLECKNNRIKNTNKTHCNIDHLKPMTKYAVRASIVNSGGGGNFSHELIFRTRKEMPALLTSSASSLRHNNYFLFSYLVLLPTYALLRITNYIRVDMILDLSQIRVRQYVSI